MTPSRTSSMPMFKLGSLCCPITARPLRSISRKIESREVKSYFIYGLALKMVATIIFANVNVQTG